MVVGQSLESNKYLHVLVLTTIYFEEYIVTIYFTTYLDILLSQPYDLQYN